MKMCDAFAGNCDRVTLYCTGSPGIDRRTVFADFDVENEFELRPISEPDVFASSLYYGLRSALDARARGVDIAYGRSITGCFSAAMLGLPVVYEVHQPGHDHWAYRWMFRRLANSGNFLRLVAISRKLADYYRDRFDLPEVIVAHDCADEPPVVDANLGSPDRLQVGYIGQLYEGKGMNLIAELVQRCRWADFHIVGGMEEDIDRWQDRLSKSSNVTFYGFVPYAETHPYRQAVDVALAPYQREVYGHGDSGVDLSNWMSPLKVFEYMAAGTPMIASDLPVLQEVLTDGENALLCDPDSPDEWVRALLRLRDDSATRLRLGENARGDFEAHYTWQRRSERVLAGVR